MVQVTFDFGGVVPVEGGGSSDYVVPGRYTLKVEKFDQTITSSGHPMINVAYSIATTGTEFGKRIRDNFVLAPGKDGKASFGMQRLMGFFYSLGLKVPQGTVSFDTDAMLGRMCEADVADDKIPATAEYPERTVSKPRTYHFPESVKADIPVAVAAPVAAPPPPVALPAVAPVAVPPAPVAVPAAPVAVPAAPPAAPPPPAAPVEVPASATLDDLFST